MGDADSWDARAATFDDEPDHGLRDPLTREAWRRLLVEHLPAPPAEVLDLGCGTGSLSVLLAEQGHLVRGLDMSPAMVARARAKASAAGAGVGASFVVGDAADPACDDRSADVVLSRHVLWALPDPDAALARWVDLLRPGGRLVLVEGRWHTGAGLTAEECVELVRRRREHADVVRLDDPVLWGGPIEDERYLVLSLR